MKIEMIGYNDKKAIAMHGIIKTMPFLIISLIVSCFILIPTLIFHIYALLAFFLFPVLLFIFMIMQYTINFKKKDINQKHIFCLKDGMLYKDGKEMKYISNIKLYKFKKYLFIEWEKIFYRIKNEDYIMGSRDEFLSYISFYSRHSVAFKLPFKTDEEIVDMLFKKIDLEEKERLFYSQDKRKIIYIYKNFLGSYSVGYEKIFIAYDEERYFSGQYGWWEMENRFISFYGTVEEALKDIQFEIKNFIEM